MDIKTTGKLWHFEDSMKEFDYCRQLCFYFEAVNWYMTEIGLHPIEWEFKYYIIAIDTLNSEIRVFNLPEQQILDEYDKIYGAISDILWHMGTGDWEHSRVYYTGDGSETLNL